MEELIKQILDDYIAENRPPEEVRKLLDIGYEFVDQQTVELYEIRPRYDKPDVILHHPYARIKYVKASKVFKLYWQQANGEWAAYEPFPQSKELQHLLDEITEDNDYLFRG